MLPAGEDEDVAARLGVPVGVCVVHRLFLCCGKVFSFIRLQWQGGVGPCIFGVWEGSKGHILRVVRCVFFCPQGEGHGATVYASLDLEATAKRVV